MKSSQETGRALRQVAMALASLYAPYAWLLLIDHPWNSYRWHWIHMWPVLPGLLVHAIPAVHRQPDWVGYLLMGAVTVLILIPIVVLAQRNLRTAILVAVVVGALSSANAWIAYELFLF
jgi:hypothetical protein